MKKIILGVGLLGILFLVAGCARQIAPSKPVAGKGKAERTAKSTEGLGDSGAGLATKEEQMLALKGEDVPLAKGTGEERVRLPLSAEEKEAFVAIHFDFDKSDIRTDARPALEKVAVYLKAHPEVRIVIEGNCDEWGTEEYNLALGERRALSTRRYLVSLGISAGRLNTVSFGEERPEDLGHNEAAYQANRRCEFKIVE
ncbi:MAG: peptidoglycan-associated lipoprotein Pal [Candidatus Omnitrophota bacterium]